MRKRGAVACGLLGLAGLAGCGTTVIDSSKVEARIKQEATSAPFNLSVKSVSCPSDRPAKAGDKFDCTMTLQNGETVSFEISQLDGKGDVHIRQAQEISTYVENVITARLAARGIKAKTTCPQHVAVVVGAKFDCAIVAANGKHAIAPVTITSTDGSFTVGTLQTG